MVLGISWASSVLFSYVGLFDIVVEALFLMRKLLLANLPSVRSSFLAFIGCIGVLLYFASWIVPLVSLL